MGTLYSDGALNDEGLESLHINACSTALSQKHFCLLRECKALTVSGMFVFWFLRGGATLLLTSPLLHVCFPCSSFLILPADV